MMKELLFLLGKRSLLYFRHIGRETERDLREHCMIVMCAPSYRVWPFCNNHHSGCFLHLASGKNLFQWKTWLGSGWWAIWVQRTPLLVVTLLLPIKLFHLIFKISHSEENSVGRYSMGAVQFQDRINIYLIKRSEFLTRPSKQCEFCDYLFD